MSNSNRRRIRNISSRLKFFLNTQEHFHFGLPFDEYLQSPLLAKYGLPKIFPTEGESVEPLPKGTVTKANSSGKFVKKIPEEYETIKKHISYTRKRDGHKVEYDREYKVFKKVKLHQFNSTLNFVINSHGEKLVISEKLLYDTIDELKATHIANMFLELFNNFEVYDEDFNPAIHFNTTFEKIILPSGSLDNLDNFTDLIEISKRFNKNEDQQRAVHKRLQVLKSFNPDIRGKGPNGFMGYIVFGFSDLGIVLLETMYSDNATYIFTIQNFENQVLNDKQTVLSNKLHEKRFFHNENWEESIKKYLKKLNKKS